MSERELGFLGFSAFFLFLLVLAIWRIGQEMKKNETLTRRNHTLAGDIEIKKLQVLALQSKLRDQFDAIEMKKAEVDELQAMLEIARQNFVDLNRVLRQAGFNESRNDRLIDGEWDDETKEDDLPDAWR